MFNLTRSCKNCPFRSGVPPYVRPERVQEIAKADIFHCHKTVKHDDDGEPIVPRNRQTCCASGRNTLQPRC